MNSLHTGISMNIVGVARNCGSALSETILKIEDLTARLDRYSIVIATNDNDDDTDQILADFSERCSELQIIRLDGLACDFPERVERICVARNSVLGHLNNSNEFTIVLDLDGPNTCLDPVKVMRMAQRSIPHWDAVFANSRPAYYDIYALRCKGWCNEDIWKTFQNTRKPLLNRRRWRQNLLKKLVYDRQFDIPTYHPLIPVDSAFCGAGLYKTQALIGLRYSCLDSAGRLICEHVMLHQQMRARGANLFIDPAFKTNAPTEHLGEGSGALFTLHP